MLNSHPESQDKPPGWYFHSGSHNVQRFWDGANWTNEVRLGAPEKRITSISSLLIPKKWKWYVLLFVFLALLTLNLFTFSNKQSNTSVETSSNFKSDAKQEIVIPTDFVDSGSGVAYFSTPSNECGSEQFGCTKIEIFAYKDCPKGVKVFANLYSESGQEVARTDAMSSPLVPGSSTSILLSTALNSAVFAQVNHFVCM